MRLFYFQQKKHLHGAENKSENNMSLPCAEIKSEQMKYAWCWFNTSKDMLTNTEIKSVKKMVSVMALKINQKKNRACLKLANVKAFSDKMPQTPRF